MWHQICQHWLRNAFVFDPSVAFCIVCHVAQEYVRTGLQRTVLLCCRNTVPHIYMATPLYRSVTVQLFRMDYCLLYCCVTIVLHRIFTWQHYCILVWQYNCFVCFTCKLYYCIAILPFSTITGIYMAPLATVKYLAGESFNVSTHLSFLQVIASSNPNLFCKRHQENCWSAINFWRGERSILPIADCLWRLVTSEYRALDWVLLIPVVLN